MGDLQSFDVQMRADGHVLPRWFHEVTSYSGGPGAAHLALNYWLHPPDNLGPGASAFSRPYRCGGARSWSPTRERLLVEHSYQSGWLMLALIRAYSCGRNRFWTEWWDARRESTKREDVESPAAPESLATECGERLPLAAAGWLRKRVTASTLKCGRRRHQRSAVRRRGSSRVL